MKTILNTFFLYLVFCFSVTVQAGTLQEIEKLESGKGVNSVTPEKTIPTIKESNVIRLSNGKETDISAWQIVHFIKSDCPYCHQFDPTLKQIAESLRIPVFVYSFDGKGDASFPEVFPVNEEILRVFFAEVPQRTPTSFLVNVDTLVTLPLSQGAISANSFLQRLDESFLLIDRLQNEKGIIQ